MTNSTMKARTEPSRDVRISKALSYLLRHGAEKEGLNIDPAGYVKVDELLRNNRLKSHKATWEDIQRVVETNEKKRFHIEMRDDEAYICATQGHSLKNVDGDLQLLKPEEYPSQLIHGTTPKGLKEIMNSEGLSRMNRNHIHFTPLLKDTGEEVSGLRSFTNVLIFLDIEKLQEHPEIKLYRSLNNVYLTPGNERGFVPKDLFLKVVDRKTGEFYV